MNEVLIIEDHPLVTGAIRKQIASAFPLVNATVCADVNTAKFFEVLLKVFNGERVFPPKDRASRFKNEMPRITKRQAQILQLVSRGLTSKQIGSRLFITKGTVNNHINAAMAALNICKRSHAAAKAIELGMIDPSAEFNDS